MSNVIPPPPPAAPPAFVPAAAEVTTRKGCSPGCKTAAVGCGGMILGSLLTIAVQVALVVQGVTAISDFVGRQTASGPSYRGGGEPEDPASLGLRTTRRDALLQKCGTPEEQTNPDVAAVCSEQRAIDEIDERNMRRDARERAD